MVGSLVSLAGEAREVSSPFVVTWWWALGLSLLFLGLVGWFFQWVIGMHQGTDVSTRRRGLKALVIGSDNRASTSKLQASLWTAAVFFALSFLLILGRSIGCGKPGNTSVPECSIAREFGSQFAEVIQQPLQAEYFVLLGFPLAAALSAKALVTSKLATHTLKKDKAPEQGTISRGLSEVVSSDKGELDLIDFQYFGFNILTLLFFFFEFLGDPGAGLPELPPTLIGLAGLAAATYTTKKALQADAPQ